MYQHAPFMKSLTGTCVIAITSLTVKTFALVNKSSILTMGAFVCSQLKFKSWLTKEETKNPLKQAKTVSKEDAITQLTILTKTGACVD